MNQLSKSLFTFTFIAFSGSAWAQGSAAVTAEQMKSFSEAVGKSIEFGDVTLRQVSLTEPQLIQLIQATRKAEAEHREKMEAEYKKPTKDFSVQESMALGRDGFAARSNRAQMLGVLSRMPNISDDTVKLIVQEANQNDRVISETFKDNLPLLKRAVAVSGGGNDATSYIAYRVFSLNEELDHSNAGDFIPAVPHIAQDLTGYYKNYLKTKERIKKGETTSSVLFGTYPPSIQDELQHYRARLLNGSSLKFIQSATYSVNPAARKAAKEFIDLIKNDPDPAIQERLKSAEPDLMKSRIQEVDAMIKSLEFLKAAILKDPGTQGYFDPTQSADGKPGQVENWINP